MMMTKMVTMMVTMMMVMVMLTSSMTSSSRLEAGMAYSQPSPVRSRLVSTSMMVVVEVLEAEVLETVYESSLMVESRLGASRGSVSSSEARDTAATLHVQQPITPELQTSPLY